MQKLMCNPLPRWGDACGARARQRFFLFVLVCSLSACASSASDRRDYVDFWRLDRWANRL